MSPYLVCTHKVGSLHKRKIKGLAAISLKGPSLNLTVHVQPFLLTSPVQINGFSDSNTAYNYSERLHGSYNDDKTSYHLHRTQHAAVPYKSTGPPAG